MSFTEFIGGTKSKPTRKDIRPEVLKDCAVAYFANGDLISPRGPTHTIVGGWSEQPFFYRAGIAGELTHWVDSTDFTMTWLNYMAPQVGDGYVLSVYGDAIYGIRVLRAGPAKRLYAEIRTTAGTRYITPSTEWLNTNTPTVECIVRRGDSVAFYSNGKLIETETGCGTEALSILPSGIPKLLVGVSNGHSSGWVVVNNYAFDDALIASIAKNRSVLKTREQDLYFSTGSVAIPTLSSPGVTNILATSATPQVTLTF